jgi:hypothetical protein
MGWLHQEILAKGLLAFSADVGFTVMFAYLAQLTSTGGSAVSALLALRAVPLELVMRTLATYSAVLLLFPVHAYLAPTAINTDGALFTVRTDLAASTVLACSSVLIVRAYLATFTIFAHGSDPIV